VQNMFVLSRVM